MRYKSGEGYAYCRAAAALASSAAATAGLTFLPSFHRTRGGGARLRRPSRERTRTTERVMKIEKGSQGSFDVPCEWMAHETQYAILMYSLGITYSEKATFSQPLMQNW